LRNDVSGRKGRGKIMRKYFASISIVLLILAVSGSASAGLVLLGTDSVGNRLIYDEEQNITWYDFTRDKQLWEEQMSWAGGLSVEFYGTVYDDWRLPTTIPECSSYNCTGSEMGHLYYIQLARIIHEA